jgi:hypothetical protein
VGEGLQPVWPFQPVQGLVRQLYSSREGGAATVSSFLNAHYLMTYIKRDGNLYSLIVRESRFGRDVRWRYGLRKYLEEELLPNLTFIDVALTATIRNTYNETVQRIHDKNKTGKKPKRQKRMGKHTRMENINKTRTPPIKPNIPLYSIHYPR